MRENQLFLRDLVRVVLAITVVTAVALLLAPRRPAPSRSPATVAASTHAIQLPTTAQGARLFESKGCLACHTVDGTAKIGPSLRHAFGTVVTLDDGSHVTFDEAYLRESVMVPRARSRLGYPPTMPAFDGVLSPRDLDAIVAYVRSLE